MVDISVGLHRASSIAMAPPWLDWATGRLSVTDDVVDGNIIKGLEGGL